MTKGSVYIVGSDLSVSNMFLNEGFKVTSLIGTADVVCFLGGFDINPELYNQELGPKMRWTSVSLSDDTRDLGSYRKLRNDQLKVGICRGGQFLNVMSGGSMYQHVNGHTNQHKIYDTLINPGEEVVVTSSHHQQMIPGAGAEVLGYSEGISDEFWGDKGKVVPPKFESEVLFYDSTKSLCFQPHPEWNLRGTHDSCSGYFFDIIDLIR
jgi:hypothetical protein